MTINSNNYAAIRDDLRCICGGNPGDYEGPLRDCPVHEDPIIFTADYWRVQMSKAVMQLVREVHALNPGIVFEADLRPIEQVANAHARMEVSFP